jgi:hypothetical protein
MPQDVMQNRAGLLAARDYAEMLRFAGFDCYTPPFGEFQ